MFRLNRSLSKITSFKFALHLLVLFIDLDFDLSSAVVCDFYIPIIVLSRKTKLIV